MTERIAPHSSAEAPVPAPAAEMPPSSSLQGVPPTPQTIPLGDMTELSGPLSSVCLPSIATATSPLDYIDGLPSDKREGEDVVQYEQQGSGNASQSEATDSKLRGGVEVKLGQSGVPEGDKLAELDFLRQSIESYR